MPVAWHAVMLSSETKECVMSQLAVDKAEIRRVGAPTHVPGSTEMSIGAELDPVLWIGLALLGVGRALRRGVRTGDHRSGAPVVELHR